MLQKIRIHKKTFKILIIFLIIVLLNLGYFLFVKWQDYSAKRNLANQKVELKTYRSDSMNFEIKYPPSWILVETEKMIEVNPPSKATNKYFSVSERDEFKSLEEIKKKLSPTLPTSRVAISDSEGFKYTDSDFHDSIWLEHAGHIYLIRVYPVVYEAQKILASFKFN